MLYAEMPIVKQSLPFDVYLRALHGPLRPGILPGEHEAGEVWVSCTAPESTRHCERALDMESMLSVVV